MQITKIGHCCLLIKEEGLTILTDPGNFSSGQSTLTGVDVVLITHEHSDHLHIDSVKKVIKNNPEVVVYANSGVGKILDEENINCNLLEGGDKVEVRGVLIEGLGEKHAPIYPSVPEVINTGYLIAEKLFYPGDALYVLPEKKVEVLALPVVAPWLRISQSLDYAKKIKPKKCFPVHDGYFGTPGPFYKLPRNVLGEAGIEFMEVELRKEYEV